MRSKKYGEFLKTKLNNLPAVVTGSDLIIGLGFVRFDQTFSSKLNVVSPEARTLSIVLYKMCMVASFGQVHLQDKVGCKRTMIITSTV